jgi:hypothetical protein
MSNVCISNDDNIPEIYLQISPIVDHEVSSPEGIEIKSGIPTLGNERGLTNFYVRRSGTSRRYSTLLHSAPKNFTDNKYLV